VHASNVLFRARQPIPGYDSISGAGHARRAVRFEVDEELEREHGERRVLVFELLPGRRVVRDEERGERVEVERGERPGRPEVAAGVADEELAADEPDVGLDALHARAERVEQRVRVLVCASDQHARAQEERRHVQSLCEWNLTPAAPAPGAEPRRKAFPAGAGAPVQPMKTRQTIESEPRSASSTIIAGRAGGWRERR
jgi:hypothetical protein